MFIPVVAYFIIFKYIPMSGIAIAFQNYRIKSQSFFAGPWVGLDNFTKAFNTPTFARSVTNTLAISGLKLLFGFPAPIILALMLNEVSHARFKKTIQTITYLPHFLSWIVLAGMFQQLLSPNNGAVNAVLRDVFGIKESIYFLGDNKYFRGTLIVTDIWKNVGWSSILYLATITGIDPALYEAATVDGASRWQCTRYITIPSLVSTIVVMLILNVGSIMDAGFDQVFNLYNSAVYRSGSARVSRSPESETASEESCMTATASRCRKSSSRFSPRATGPISVAPSARIPTAKKTSSRKERRFRPLLYPIVVFMELPSVSSIFDRFRDDLDFFPNALTHRAEMDYNV